MFAAQIPQLRRFIVPERARDPLRQQVLREFGCGFIAAAKPRELVWLPTPTDRARRINRNPEWWPRRVLFTLSRGLKSDAVAKLYPVMNGRAAVVPLASFDA